MEKNVKGKSVDVVLEKDGQAIAVEIAVTDKHEAINVSKDIFQAGFTQVVIIGLNKQVVAAVKKRLSLAFDDDVLSEVRCCVLSDFLGG